MNLSLHARIAGIVCWFAVVIVPALEAKERWLVGRSPHFEILSGASERDSRLLLAELEQFRYTFLAVFNFPPAHEVRTQIVLFDSESEFDKYSPLYNGKVRRGAGYFLGRPDQFTIVMKAGREVERTCEIIFHEYVHQMLHARGIHPPAWLNEGLAEVYSTFKWTGDAAEIGHPKSWHVLLLSRSKLMPLKDLFAIDRKSPDYNEGTRQGLFYAQSWALLHMFICGENRSYQGKLGQFLDAMDSEGTAGPEAFQAAFGMTYEDMQTELRGYLNGGRYLLRSAKVPPFDAKKIIRLQPASDLERDGVLWDLIYRTRKSNESRFRLIELAERFPAAPRPLESLAMIGHSEEGPQRALDFWKQAVERQTENAYAYFQVASPQARALLNTTSLDYRLPAEIAAQHRQWLDRALQLSPHYSEAHEALALIEAFAEAPRIAVINEIQNHVNGMRDRTRTLLALAIVRWRKGDTKTAQQILGLVQAAPKARPQVKRLARLLEKRLAEAAPASVATPAVAAKPGE